mgnify:CR=1 FL=1
MQIHDRVTVVLCVLLASCHHSPIVVNEDEEETTKILYKRQGKCCELVVGHWLHFSQTEMRQIKRDIIFKADGKYTAHLLFKI